MSVPDADFPRHPHELQDQAEGLETAFWTVGLLGLAARLLGLKPRAARAAATPVRIGLQEQHHCFVLEFSGDGEYAGCLETRFAGEGRQRTLRGAGVRTLEVAASHLALSLQCISPQPVQLTVRRGGQVISRQQLTPYSGRFVLVTHPQGLPAPA